MFKLPKNDVFNNLSQFSKWPPFCTGSEKFLNRERFKYLFISLKIATKSLNQVYDNEKT